MTYDSTAGLVLFDDYAIATEGGRYRRPTFQEVTEALQTGTSNAFTQSARIFANDFKALCLFAPHVVVDAMWVFNNPHLFYLSNLAPGDPGYVRPALQDNRFLRIYWASREIRKYEKILEATYPIAGRPTYPEASWLKDIFNADQPGFHRLIRPRLEDFISSSLEPLEKTVTSVTVDPRTLMLENMEALVNSAGNLLANIEGLDSTSEKSFTNTLGIILDYYGKTNERFRIPVAFKLVAETVLPQLKPLVEWAIYDHVYLKAHALAISAGPSGYGLGSLSLGSIVNLQYPSPSVRGNDVLLKQVRSIIPNLGQLSFETIFSDRVRKSKFFGAYETRLKQLDKIQLQHEREKQFCGAIVELMGNLAPVLAKETGNKVFRDIKATKAGWIYHGEAMWLWMEENFELPIGYIVRLGRRIPLLRPLVEPMESFRKRKRGSALLCNLLLQQGQIDDPANKID